MGCRIGIISDIHFGKFSRTNELAVPGEEIQDNTVGAAPLVEGAVEVFKKNSIKYLFIAGDLTSVASPQEYYYCEKKIITFAEAVGINKDNVVFCAGNHDVDRNISDLAQKYVSGREEVQQIITERYQRVAAATGIHILTDMILPANGVVPLSGIIEKEDFIVFILNTGLYCSEKQVIVHGKLGKDQLCWLKSSLNDLKNDPRIKIVLMHHHPISYAYPVPSWDTSRVEEDSEFKDIIGEMGVSIVIHGHRHHPRVTTVMESNWRQSVTFLCAGSFSVNAKHRAEGEIPNTLHILELRDQREKYLLYNYQYKSGVGWLPAQYDGINMPLDFRMQIGKLITDDIARGIIIEKYKDRQGTLKWDDLDDELKYLPAKKLNELFRMVMKPRYSVIGYFPEEIALLVDNASVDSIERKQNEICR